MLKTDSRLGARKQMPNPGRNMQMAVPGIPKQPGMARKKELAQGILLQTGQPRGQIPKVKMAQRMLRQMAKVLKMAAGIPLQTGQPRGQGIPPKRMGKQKSRKRQH